MKRILSVFLIMTLVSAGSLFSVKALNKKADVDASASSTYADYVDNDGNKYLLDPETGKYKKIVNIEAEVARLSALNERDYEFERLFLERRLAGKAASVVTENNRQELSISEPIPGGIGGGAYYSKSFFHNFTTGTRLSYDIICPTKAGGDVSYYLYLTGMNRAAKGVEAFISYYAQESMRFKIWDWSVTGDMLVVNMSYDQLLDYIGYKSINGVTRQIITVQHATLQISSTQWQNIVWITNYSEDIFYQIYSHTYTATLSDQYDDYYGKWAAIVETFQDYYYQDLNVMGFNLVYVQSKNTPYSNSTWDSWVLLTDSVSWFYGCYHGLLLDFITQNYTFGIK